jgi:uncharacterized membrane protein
MSNSQQTAQPLPGYKIHWHIILIHLPISFFLATALFALLYLIIPHPCFDLALLITLVIGLIGLIPVIITGWFTWKGKYKGFRGMLFNRKILTAFIMLVVSFILLVMHILSNFVFHFGGEIIWRVVYFIVALLLAFGAAIEGFYGGRLNHK